MTAHQSDDAVGFDEEAQLEGRAAFERAREHLEYCNALVDELFPASERVGRPDIPMRQYQDRGEHPHAT